MLNNQEKYGYPVTVYLLRADYDRMESYRAEQGLNRTNFIRAAVAEYLAPHVDKIAADGVAS